ncbi:hypothetical protein SNEBB_001077 [Seison nebaliae]|nr:hypothetical protein SNEBB_001077 [Seison nebaliae]
MFLLHLYLTIIFCFFHSNYASHKFDDYECVIDKKHLHGNVEIGTSYNYNYTASVTNQGAKFHLECYISMTYMDRCRWRLKISGMQIEEAFNSVNKTMHDIGKDLEKFAVYYHYSIGQVKDIYFAKEETIWSKNFKRGIISVFQLTKSVYNTDVEYANEKSVLGNCPVTYLRSDIYVLKDIMLSNCKNRVMSGIDYPFAYSPSFNSKLKEGVRIIGLTQEYTCTYKLSNQSNFIADINCFEWYRFRVPKSYKTNTDTCIKMIINYTTTEYLDKLKDVQNLTNYLLHMESYVREDIEYDHSLPIFQSIPKIDRLEEIVSRLNVFCKKEIRYDGYPSIFANMILLLRKSTYKEMEKIHKRLNCFEAKSFFDDIIMVAGTDSAIKYSITNYLCPACRRRILEKMKIINRMQLSYGKTNLMNTFALKEFLNLIKYYEKLESNETELIAKLHFSMMTMMKKFCQMNNCQTNGMIKKIKRYIEQQVLNACQQSNVDHTIYKLQTLSEIAIIDKRLIDLLRKCWNLADFSNTNFEKIEIKIVLIKTMTQFIQRNCSHEFGKLLLVDMRQCLLDKEENVELRMECYETLIKCPSNKLFIQIYNLLKDDDESDQLQSFVWSHLSNIESSRYPQTATEYIDFMMIIDDKYLRNKFQLFNKFYSKNYRYSTYNYMKRLGMDVSMTVKYTTENWLPRSANLNVTVAIFGIEINVIDLHLRHHQLELLIERYYKKEHINPTKEKYKKYKKFGEEKFHFSLFLRLLTENILFFRKEVPLDFITTLISREAFLKYLLKFINEQTGQSDSKSSSHPNDQVNGHMLKNHLLLDMVDKLPTSIGLPIYLAFNATSHSRFRMKTKTTTSNKIYESRGRIYPSFVVTASINVFVRFNEYHVFGVNTQSVLELSFDMIYDHWHDIHNRGTNKKTIQSSIGLTNALQKIFQLKTYAYSFSRDRFVPIRQKSDNLKFCSSDYIKQMTGIRTCVRYSNTNASLIPSFSVTIEREPELRRYNLFVEMVDLKPLGQQPDFFLSLSTDKSTIKRYFKLAMFLDRIRKNFELEITSSLINMNLKGGLQLKKLKEHYRYQIISTATLFYVPENRYKLNMIMEGTLSSYLSKFHSFYDLLYRLENMSLNITSTANRNHFQLCLKRDLKWFDRSIYIIFNLTQDFTANASFHYNHSYYFWESKLSYNSLNKLTGKRSQFIHQLKIDQIQNLNVISNFQTHISLLSSINHQFKYSYWKKINSFHILSTLEMFNISLLKVNSSFLLKKNYFCQLPLWYNWKSCSWLIRSEINYNLTQYYSNISLNHHANLSKFSFNFGEKEKLTEFKLNYPLRKTKWNQNQIHLSWKLNCSVSRLNSTWIRAQLEIKWKFIKGKPILLSILLKDKLSVSVLHFNGIVDYLGKKKSLNIVGGLSGSSIFIKGSLNYSETHFNHEFVISTAKKRIYVQKVIIEVNVNDIDRILLKKDKMSIMNDVLDSFKKIDISFAIPKYSNYLLLRLLFHEKRRLYFTKNKYIVLPKQFFVKYTANNMALQIHVNFHIFGTRNFTMKGVMGNQSRHASNFTTVVCRVDLKSLNQWLLKVNVYQNQTKMITQLFRLAVVQDFLRSDEETRGNLQLLLNIRKNYMLEIKKSFKWKNYWIPNNFNLIINRNIDQKKMFKIILGYKYEKYIDDINHYSIHIIHNNKNSTLFLEYSENLKDYRLLDFLLKKQILSLGYVTELLESNYSSLNLYYKTDSATEDGIFPRYLQVAIKNARYDILLWNLHIRSPNATTYNISAEYHLRGFQSITTQFFVDLIKSRYIGQSKCTLSTGLQYNFLINIDKLDIDLSCIRTHEKHNTSSFITFQHDLKVLNGKLKGILILHSDFAQLVTSFNMKLEKFVFLQIDYEMIGEWKSTINFNKKKWLEVEVLRNRIQSWQVTADIAKYQCKLDISIEYDYEDMLNNFFTFKLIINHQNFYLEARSDVIIDHRIEYRSNEFTLQENFNVAIVGRKSQFTLDVIFGKSDMSFSNLLEIQHPTTSKTIFKYKVGYENRKLLLELVNGNLETLYFYEKIGNLLRIEFHSQNQIDKNQRQSITLESNVHFIRKNEYDIQFRMKKKGNLGNYHKYQFRMEKKNDDRNIFVNWDNNNDITLRMHETSTNVIYRLEFPSNLFSHQKQIYKYPKNNQIIYDLNLKIGEINFEQFCYLDLRKISDGKEKKILEFKIKNSTNDGKSDGNVILDNFKNRKVFVPKQLTSINSMIFKYHQKSFSINFKYSKDEKITDLFYVIKLKTFDFKHHSCIKSAQDFDLNFELLNLDILVGKWKHQFNLGKNKIFNDFHVEVVDRLKIWNVLHLDIRDLFKEKRKLYSKMYWEIVNEMNDKLPKFSMRKSIEINLNEKNIIRNWLTNHLIVKYSNNSATNHQIDIQTEDNKNLYKILGRIDFGEITCKIKSELSKIKYHYLTSQIKWNEKNIIVNYHLNNSQDFQHFIKYSNESSNIFENSFNWKRNNNLVNEINFQFRNKYRWNSNVTLLMGKRLEIGIYTKNEKKENFINFQKLYLPNTFHEKKYYLLMCFNRVSGELCGYRLNTTLIRLGRFNFDSHIGNNLNNSMNLRLVMKSKTIQLHIDRNDVFSYEIGANYNVESLKEMKGQLKFQKKIRNKKPKEINLSLLLSKKYSQIISSLKISNSTDKLFVIKLVSNQQTPPMLFHYMITVDYTRVSNQIIFKTQGEKFKEKGITKLWIETEFIVKNELSLKQLLLTRYDKYRFISLKSVLSSIQLKEDSYIFPFKHSIDYSNKNQEWTYISFFTSKDQMTKTELKFDRLNSDKVKWVGRISRNNSAFILSPTIFWTIEKNEKSGNIDIVFYFDEDNKDEKYVIRSYFIDNLTYSLSSKYYQINDFYRPDIRLIVQLQKKRLFFLNGWIRRNFWEQLNDYFKNRFLHLLQQYVIEEKQLKSRRLQKLSITQKVLLSSIKSMLEDIRDWKIYIWQFDENLSFAQYEKYLEMANQAVRLQFQSYYSQLRNGISEVYRYVSRKVVFHLLDRVNRYVTGMLMRSYWKFYSVVNYLQQTIRHRIGIAVREKLINYLEKYLSNPVKQLTEKIVQYLVKNEKKCAKGLSNFLLHYKSNLSNRLELLMGTNNTKYLSERLFFVNMNDHALHDYTNNLVNSTVIISHMVQRFIDRKFNTFVHNFPYNSRTAFLSWFLRRWSNTFQFIFRSRSELQLSIPLIVPVEHLSNTIPELWRNSRKFLKNFSSNLYCQILRYLGTMKDIFQDLFRIFYLPSFKTKWNNIFAFDRQSISYLIEKKFILNFDGRISRLKDYGINSIILLEGVFGRVSYETDMIIYDISDVEGKLIISKDNSITFNAKKIGNVPLLYGNIFRLYRNGIYLCLERRTWFTICWSFTRQTCFVQLDKSTFGKVSGIFGNQNNEKCDDDQKGHNIWRNSSDYHEKDEKMCKIIFPSTNSQQQFCRYLANEKYQKDTPKKFCKLADDFNYRNRFQLKEFHCKKCRLLNKVLEIGDTITLNRGKAILDIVVMYENIQCNNLFREEIFSTFFKILKMKFIINRPTTKVRIAFVTYGNIIEPTPIYFNNGDNPFISLTKITQVNLRLFYNLSLIDTNKNKRNSKRFIDSLKLVPYLPFSPLTNKLLLHFSCNSYRPTYFERLQIKQMLMDQNIIVGAVGPYELMNSLTLRNKKEIFADKMTNDQRYSFIIRKIDDFTQDLVMATNGILMNHRFISKRMKKNLRKETYNHLSSWILNRILFRRKSEICQCSLSSNGTPTLRCFRKE